MGVVVVGFGILVLWCSGGDSMCWARKGSRHTLSHFVWKPTVVAEPQ